MKRLVYIDIPGPWSATVKSEPISATYEYVRASGSLYSMPTTGTRYSSVKASPSRGTSIPVDGWREPTIFRGYACKIVPAPSGFNYNCIIAGLSGKHYGKHYPSNSQVLWAGTEGTGRYPIDIGADNIAKQKCLASLDKAKLQLGVMLAEMTTTIGMLSKNLSNLRSYLSDALRFLRKALKANSNYSRHIYQRILRLHLTKSGMSKLTSWLGKEAANRWLEYQYGWRPLMSDIYATATLLDEQAKRRKTIIGKGSHSSGVAPSYTFPVVNGGLMYIDSRLVSGAFCRVDWEVSNSVAAQLNRLGLTNILEIGWELVPFSFVIDWVAPIGDYLAAIGAGWGLTFKGGSITRYTSGTIRQIWTAYPYIVGNPISVELQTNAWFRYPISASTLGTKVYTRNPISVTRAVTALALLTQLKSGNFTGARL